MSPMGGLGTARNLSTDDLKWRQIVIISVISFDGFKQMFAHFYGYCYVKSGVDEFIALQLNDKYINKFDLNMRKFHH